VRSFKHASRAPRHLVRLSACSVVRVRSMHAGLFGKRSFLLKQGAVSCGTLRVLVAVGDALALAVPPLRGSEPRGRVVLQLVPVLELSHRGLGAFTVHELSKLTLRGSSCSLGSSSGSTTQCTSSPVRHHVASIMWPGLRSKRLARQSFSQGKTMSIALKAHLSHLGFDGAH
jgi:hypothetical protein